MNSLINYLLFNSFTIHCDRLISEDNTEINSINYVDLFPLFSEAELLQAIEDGLISGKNESPNDSPIFDKLWLTELGIDTALMQLESFEDLPEHIMEQVEAFIEGFICDNKLFVSRYDLSFDGTCFFAEIDDKPQFYLGGNMLEVMGSLKAYNPDLSNKPNDISGVMEIYKELLNV